MCEGIVLNFLVIYLPLNGTRKSKFLMWPLYLKSAAMILTSTLLLKIDQGSLKRHSMLLQFEGQETITQNMTLIKNEKF